MAGEREPTWEAARPVELAFAFPGGFNGSYQRNNKKGGKKHLRCFPCCGPNHKSSSACEVPIRAALRGEGLRPADALRFLAVARFLPLQEDAKSVAVDDLVDSLGDIELGAQLTTAKLAKFERSTDDPFLPLFAARSVEVGADGSQIFEFKEKAWHYGWKGGRYRQGMEHILRIYVLEADRDVVAEGETIVSTDISVRCVARLSSPTFTVYSSRSAPNKQQPASESSGGQSYQSSPVVVPLPKESAKRAFSSDPALYAQSAASSAIDVPAVRLDSSRDPAKLAMINGMSKRGTSNQQGSTSHVPVASLAQQLHHRRPVFAESRDPAHVNGQTPHAAQHVIPPIDFDRAYFDQTYTLSRANQHVAHNGAYDTGGHHDADQSAGRNGFSNEYFAVAYQDSAPGSKRRRTMNAPQPYYGYHESRYAARPHPFASFAEPDFKFKQEPCDDLDLTAIPARHPFDDSDSFKPRFTADPADSPETDLGSDGNAPVNDAEDALDGLREMFALEDEQEDLTHPLTNGMAHGEHDFPGPSNLEMPLQSDATIKHDVHNHMEVPLPFRGPHIGMRLQHRPASSRSDGDVAALDSLLFAPMEAAHGSVPDPAFEDARHSDAFRSRLRPSGSSRMSLGQTADGPDNSGSLRSIQSLPRNGSARSIATLPQSSFDDALVQTCGADDSILAAPTGAQVKSFFELGPLFRRENKTNKKPSHRKAAGKPRWDGPQPVPKPAHDDRSPSPALSRNSKGKAAEADNENCELADGAEEHQGEEGDGKEEGAPRTGAIPQRVTRHPLEVADPANVLSSKHILAHEGERHLDLTPSAPPFSRQIERQNRSGSSSRSANFERSNSPRGAEPVPDHRVEVHDAIAASIAPPHGPPYHGDHNIAVAETFEASLMHKVQVGCTHGIKRYPLLALLILCLFTLIVLGLAKGSIRMPPPPRPISTFCLRGNDPTSDPLSRRLWPDSESRAPVFRGKFGFGRHLNKPTDESCREQVQDFLKTEEIRSNAFRKKKALNAAMIGTATVGALCIIVSVMQYIHNRRTSASPALPALGPDRASHQMDMSRPPTRDAAVVTRVT